MGSEMCIRDRPTAIVGYLAQELERLDETVHEHLQQWIAGRERAPILDVRDETNQRLGVRLVCPLTPGSTPDAARAWLRQVWPITRDVRWRLPAPMGERLRDWDRGDGSGLVALAALL